MVRSLAIICGLVSCGFAETRSVVSELTQESAVDVVDKTKSYFASKGFSQTEALDRATFYAAPPAEIEKICRQKTTECNIDHRIVVDSRIEGVERCYNQAHGLGHSISYYEHGS